MSCECDNLNIVGNIVNNRLVSFYGDREKAMAAHSSTLAWKIPWTEERGGLQSTGSQRVGHDFTFTFIYWFLGALYVY